MQTRFYLQIARRVWLRELPCWMKRQKTTDIYVAQGHSRSRISVATESPRVTSYLGIILIHIVLYFTPFPSCRGVLLKLSHSTGVPLSNERVRGKPGIHDYEIWRLETTDVSLQ